MPPRAKNLTKTDQANAAKAKAAQAEITKLTKQLSRARASRDRAVSALLARVLHVIRGAVPA